MSSKTTTNSRYAFVILCLLLAQGFWATSRAYGQFAYFDVNDVGEQNNRTQKIEPWKVVNLDPAYGGQWVAAGDVDGDGQVEIVSAENVNKDDIHYTSTAVAQKLDGTVLWRWGNPDIGARCGITMSPVRFTTGTATANRKSSCAQKII